MKKIYMIPAMSIVRLSGEQMLAGSGVIGNKGIGFGGTDEDGSKEPAVKGSVFEENPFE